MLSYPYSSSDSDTDTDTDISIHVVEMTGCIATPDLLLLGQIIGSKDQSIAYFVFIGCKKTY